MNRPQPSNSDKCARVDARFLLVLGLLCLSVLAIFAGSPVPANKPAAYPAWWFERDVIVRLNPTGDPNPTWPGSYTSPADFSAINQGQLKNLAVRACEELNAKLPGGSGANLGSLYNTLQASTSGNFNPVNLGQLKNLALPFYDRLIEVGYTTSYPWASSGGSDYAMANIGQVKNLFSFDLTAPEGQLPDWWKKYYFGDLSQDATALTPSGSGLTLLQAYQQGLNPFGNEEAPPAAPSNFRSTRISDTQVKYEWDDNSNNERGFVIERFDGTNWVVVTRPGPNQTSVIVTAP